ncbi:MAG: tetratricopeptide repeat protein [Chloroflexi bacterium]|nr:tetratricopeptide repeat protein [Chloroflexota bacterium]
MTETNPDNQFIKLGDEHRERGELDQAVAAYTKAIELNQERIKAHYRRGLVYYDLNGFPRAIEDFGVVLKDDPENKDALTYRGLSYAQLKNYQLALADFEKLLPMEPDVPELLFMVGYTIARFELDYYDAISYFDRAIQLDPDFAEPYRERAHLYYRLDNWKRALQDFEKYLSFPPETPKCHKKHADVYILPGRFSDAARAYENYLKLSKQKIKWHIYLKILWLRMRARLST